VQFRGQYGQPGVSLATGSLLFVWIGMGDLSLKLDLFRKNGLTYYLNYGELPPLSISGMSSGLPTATRSRF
jgi:hypothetical protein